MVGTASISPITLSPFTFDRASYPNIDDASPVRPFGSKVMCFRGGSRRDRMARFRLRRCAARNGRAPERESFAQGQVFPILPFPRGLVIVPCATHGARASTSGDPDEMLFDIARHVGRTRSCWLLQELERPLRFLTQRHLRGRRLPLVERRLRPSRVLTRCPRGTMGRRSKRS